MAINFNKTTFKNNQSPAIDEDFLNGLQDNIKENLTNIDNRISELEKDNNLTTSKDAYLQIETETNKLWYDTKKIYRKVIRGTVKTGTRCDLYTDTNIETLVSAEGFLSYSNHAGYHKIGGYANANFYSFLQFNSQKILTFWGTEQYNNSEYYIILEYTKID